MIQTSSGVTQLSLYNIIIITAVPLSFKFSSLQLIVISAPTNFADSNRPGTISAASLQYKYILYMYKFTIPLIISRLSPTYTLVAPMTFAMPIARRPTGPHPAISSYYTLSSFIVLHTHSIIIYLALKFKLKFKKQGEILASIIVCYICWPCIRISCPFGSIPSRAWCATPQATCTQNRNVLNPLMGTVHVYGA